MEINLFSWDFVSCWTISHGTKGLTIALCTNEPQEKILFNENKLNKRRKLNTKE